MKVDFHSWLYVDYLCSIKRLSRRGITLHLSRVQEVILFEDVFFIGLGDFSIHLNEIRQEERIARKRKDMHITEFQNMMRRIYHRRDVRRGTARTLEWLREEVGELGEALKGEDRRALENEFADAMAWLASLANLVDVDLENAIEVKYNGKCPKCQQTPCGCPFRFP